MTFKSSAKSHDHNSVDSNLTSNTTGLFSSINASKDSSSVGKSMSTHISDSKAKELGSTNTKKLRASGTSTLKDKGSIHNRSERLLQDSRDKRKTQICSSSSTGSESLSESDSDLSGSSSISSTSDSNSSQSSYTSSLSNSCEMGFTSKIPSDTTKVHYGPFKSTKGRSLKKSSHSDMETSTFGSKDPKLNTSQMLREINVQFTNAGEANCQSFRSHHLPRDDKLSSSDLSKNVSLMTTKIYVGNLTRNILRSHLQEIFSIYGKIRRLDLPLDSISGFNQGYSYIDYDCHQSATDALTFMDGGFLDGQLISVQFTYPLQRNVDAVRITRRKSPKYSPNRRNWSPHFRRKLSSEYRRARSPLSRRAPARFQRRKRHESFSSSRSRTRSPSPRSHFTSKRYSSKHGLNENYRKYSRSISSQRLNNIHSTSRRLHHRSHRHTTTSSSFSSSSDSL